jgi:2-C-methyl-D-erythritol 4-phosphate cytidylyltransferase
VHDAARPLVSQELIDRTLAAAVEHGAAAPAMPVQLTIKQATGPLPAKVQQTVPRNELWALQTPQIVRRETLLRAFEECPYPLEHVTDDLQLLELCGQAAWLVPGDERNIKITTPQDLMLAELLLRCRTG